MNELVVNASEEGLRIAILQDKRVVELHNEKGNKQFSVGDIFLGRVKKLLPGLNACFVEIGHPKDAFLHYTDLGPQLRSLQGYVTKVHESSNAILDSSHFDVLPEIDKHGKINQVLKTGSPILVQIVKEAISTKGPRLTAEISLPGQFLILVPFANEVSISRKMVSSEEKKRLRKLVESIKPQNFSVIVRTAAEGKDLAALKADLDDLISKWKVMSRAIVRAKVPKKVLAEEERTTSILRDMLSMGFDQITTDDQETFDDITAYLKRRMPDSQKILKFHSNKVPLFDYFGIEKQIKALFGKTVTMGNGAYLVIEHTEALHVIDVNSGSKNLGGQTLEETARVFTPVALLGVYLSRFVRPASAEDVSYLRLAFSGSVGEPLAGRALDEGIVRTLWLTLPELRESTARHRSPLVLQCIEDHLAGSRHALDLVRTHPSVLAPPALR